MGFLGRVNRGHPPGMEVLGRAGGRGGEKRGAPWDYLDLGAAFGGQNSFLWMGKG